MPPTHTTISYALKTLREIKVGEPNFLPCCHTTRLINVTKDSFSEFKNILNEEKTKCAQLYNERKNYLTER